jgi:magnesium transporter
MLRAMSGQSAPVEIAVTRLDERLAHEAVWLDMETPTEEERAQVEHATGLCLPSREEVSEVEASSRLVQDGETLTLSTPMVSKDGTEGLISTPLGFVLSPQRLVTLRFAPSITFDQFAAHWHRTDACGGLRPFLGLLEAMVDRMADGLEHEGAQLEKLTGAVFSPAMATQTPRGRDGFLRATLTETGRGGERISHLRDGLLGVLRIVRFVREAAAAWTPEPEAKRLKTLEKDVLSLNDYEAQLLGKVQFLLDATLGYISIEQNNSVKVLTIVSLVGIPPTLIAGIYGMNFKIMPELEWHYGYAYGLAVIVLSAVLPLVWFRRRGWL